MFVFFLYLDFPFITIRPVYNHRWLNNDVFSVIMKLPFIYYSVQKNVRKHRRFRKSVLLLEKLPKVRPPEFIPGFEWRLCSSIFSFLCRVLFIIVCPFFFRPLYCLSFFLSAIVLSVLLLLAIVLSVLLRFTTSDYPFGIFKYFFLEILWLLLINWRCNDM